MNPITADALLELHSRVTGDFVDDLAAQDQRLAADWCRRLRTADAPETFVAEALAWRLLEESGCAPTYLDPSIRGADFRCSSSIQPTFDVEVTCVTFEGQAERTGLPARVFEEIVPFKFDSRKLRSVASGKTEQLRRHPVPLLLAVFSFHPHAPTLFSRPAIEESLMGTTLLDVPRIELIGEPSRTIRAITRLDEALFLRCTPFGVQPVRKELSAVLFVAVGVIDSYCIGAVHPEPNHALDRRLFGSIPLASIEPWPLHGSIAVRWSSPTEAFAKWQHGHPSLVPGW